VRGEERKRGKGKEGMREGERKRERKRERRMDVALNFV
jgi:hypothetical protein